MTFEEVRVFLETPINGIAECFECHEHGGDLPYVFANDETLYETLTTSVIEDCDNRKLVVPGDPENSALYLVLNGPCGMVEQMPSGCFEGEFENNCSSLEDRERLRLWIAAGAPQE